MVNCSCIGTRRDMPGRVHAVRRQDAADYARQQQEDARKTGQAAKAPPAAEFCQECGTGPLKPRDVASGFCHGCKKIRRERKKADEAERARVEAERAAAQPPPELDEEPQDENDGCPGCAAGERQAGHAFCAVCEENPPRDLADIADNELPAWMVEQKRALIARRALEASGQAPVRHCVLCHTELDPQVDGRILCRECNSDCPDDVDDAARRIEEAAR
jgi:hypothetical protein